MKQEFKNIEVINNTNTSRFELHVNESFVFMNYEVVGNIFSLTHTEAPKELAGSGAAAALVEKVFIFLEKENKQILPFCPYVFQFIKKHPEWKRIVNKEFPAYNHL